MPRPKDASSILGNSRGAFRKALLSLLLSKYSQKNALDIAIKELGNQCVYCGISERVSLQADHLWPQEIGGVHIPGNVVPSCPSCNSERGNKPWKDYLKKKYLSTNRDGVEKQIEKIEKYMNYYKVNEKPTIEAYLTKEEIELRENLDEILFALCEGIRSKVGDPQKRDIKFIKPEKMFDEIVETIYKYKINNTGGNREKCLSKKDK